MPISKDVINAILKNDQKLTHLDLHESDLSGEDITTLVDALNKNHAITSLDLSRNNLLSEDIQALASLVRIQKINLAQNNLSDSALDSLLLISSLRSLNLNDNDFSDKAGQKLIEKSSPSFCILAYGNKKITQAILDQMERKRQGTDPENAPNVSNAPTPFWDQSKRSSAPAVLSHVEGLVGDKMSASAPAAAPEIKIH